MRSDLERNRDRRGSPVGYALVFLSGLVLGTWVILMTLGIV